MLKIPTVKKKPTIHRPSTHQPFIHTVTVTVTSSIVMVPSFVTGEIETVTVDEVTVKIGWTGGRR